MAYTQPPAKTAGDTTLASDWNNYVRSNMIALRNLLPDPVAANYPLVSVTPGTDGTATFAQLGTAGLADGAVTTAKIAVAARGLVGEIVMWAGSEGGTIPTGWLLCNGQAVSRTGAYQPLYDVIGLSYGVGNGSTTFNVPDLRGRVPLGVSGSYARGTSGGADALNLSHAHTVPSHTHDLGNHTHSVSLSGTFRSGNPTDNEAAGTTGGQVAADGHKHDTPVTLSGTSGNPSNNTSGASAIGLTGSNLSPITSILNPYQTVNYLIFAGA